MPSVTISPSWKMSPLWGIQVLLVQKSGDHHLSLVVEIPLFTRLKIHPRWLLGISEPSTVCGKKNHAMVKMSIPKREINTYCLGCLQIRVVGCHQENMLEIGDLLDGNQFIPAWIFETHL